MLDVDVYDKVIDTLTEFRTRQKKRTLLEEFRGEWFRRRPHQRQDTWISFYEVHHSRNWYAEINVGRWYLWFKDDMDLFPMDLESRIVLQSEPPSEVCHIDDYFL